MLYYSHQKKEVEKFLSFDGSFFNMQHHDDDKKIEKFMY